MGRTPMIRRATSADRPRVEAIVQDAYASYIVRIGRPPGPMSDAYGALIEMGRVHVLEMSGEVVGLVVLIPEAEMMLLDNVAVHPEAQGRGYGRRLIAFAEDEARARGFRSIRLYTNALMDENQSLYKRLGYAETHRGAEKGFTRVYMRKILEGGG